MTELYKFVVVDNEVVVTEAIEYLHHWNEMDYEFTGAFSSASDALFFLHQNHDISLVVTNINMTDMPCVEFLKVLRRDFPDMGIIILSGYEDFNCAKEAIRLRVLEYVVKPVDIGEFKMILQQAKERLRAYTPSCSAIHDAIILSAKNYVKEHISEKLTIKIIAQAIHTSSANLRLLFPEYTGKTLFEYIINERLSLAAKLLTDSDLPISEIYYKTGYSSTKYFSKVFKKYYSLTPTEYRRIASG